MSNEPQEPTNHPVPNARLQPRGFGLKVRFHPEIKLDKKRGHLLAASLSDYLGIEKNELESHKWTFVEPLSGDPGSRLLVIVTPDSLDLDIRFPPQAQEWVERRFRAVLDGFYEQFNPSLLLNSEALVRGTLQINGDARTFLSTYVMRMDDSQIDPFGRPVHLIGLRFFFPPYQAAAEQDSAGSADWAVGIRAESLMEDPGKLFLEADAEWFNPSAWNAASADTLIAHLSTAREYLEQKVVRFIRESPQGGIGGGLGET